MGLVLRLVHVVLVFVPVLQFHFRWEVILLVVVEECVAALAFPHLVRIRVVGWQWVDAGPSDVELR